MNILIFDRVDTWAASAAAFWQERLLRQPALRLCLAAGHTPLPVYRLMHGARQCRPASFSRAVVFALDEYGGLPRQHPVRCANMLRQHLVDHIDLAPGAFHTLATESPDVDAMCRDYERAIGQGFDLVLLGLGLNGHLGLNEPGAAPDSATRRVTLTPSSAAAAAGYGHLGDLPAWGVTIGMSRLLQAREVWLLATGHGKAAIVARTIASEPRPDLPASWLNVHPNSWLFLDRDAAGELGIG